MYIADVHERASFGKRRASYDVIIIGGGVIGCGIARSLSRTFKGTFALVEKEEGLGYHASGRNSGVVHSGFYYRSESLKARFSVEGSKQLIHYCQSAGVPLQTVGTLVVGRSDEDHSVLKELERRGNMNGVQDLRIVDYREMRKLEPYVSGTEALFSPAGSIVNGKELVDSFARDSVRKGVEILRGNKVDRIQKTSNCVNLETNGSLLQAKFIINCAGLHADRMKARQVDGSEKYTVIPFRGEYFLLGREKSSLLRSMVYPTPNLDFPFLGIHLTKTTDGRIKVGPNAVLAPGREAYHNRAANLREIAEMFAFKGFWRMGKRFASLGVREAFPALSKRLFASQDMTRTVTGIRAQLVDDQGNLVDDPVIEETERAMHILNAVSPGMTASMPFADHITKIAERNFDLKTKRNAPN